MARLINAAKENPKLEQRKTKDGRISLYLEYYLGRESVPVLDEYGEQELYTDGKMKGKPKYKIRHKRAQENLNLYLVANPRTPIDKQNNKQTIELAKKIRFEREQEMLEQSNGYRLKKKQNADFIGFFQTYIDNYTKKDIRMVKLALNRFKTFLCDTPEYSKYISGIKPENLNKDMMIAFTEYLQSKSRGEGAKSIYQRFKKVINYAIEHDVIRKNPCTGVSIIVDENMLRKEVLSVEEWQTLEATHYQGENPIIRRAFIFCLYTGLRFCDVKELKYSNIDFSNKVLRFEQNKTKGHSSASGVVIPLRDDLLQLVGHPASSGSRDELIFALPSYEMCLKALRHWTKRAGIEKHITWHCARHSFATAALAGNANIKTVASLLGHNGLKHTEKYVRAVDSLKQQAIESLPELSTFKYTK